MNDGRKDMILGLSRYFPTGGSGRIDVFKYYSIPMRCASCTEFDAFMAMQQLK